MIAFVIFFFLCVTLKAEAALSAAVAAVSAPPIIVESVLKKLFTCVFIVSSVNFDLFAFLSRYLFVSLLICRKFSLTFFDALLFLPCNLRSDQSGAVFFSRLIARRDGGADPGVSADPLVYTCCCGGISYPAIRAFIRVYYFYELFFGYFGRRYFSDGRCNRYFST